MTRATKIAKKSALLLAGVSLLTATACTDPAQIDPNDPNRNAKQGALLGGALGAAVGLLTNDNKAQGAFRGALVGGGVGALVGTSLDRQEADLRRNLGNDNVTITNTGDRLIVTLPEDILFATDSAAVRPNLRRDLAAVATNLQSYPDSTIQIVGHTDNTGGAAYNQDLSARRANSVADVLMEAGVAFGRIRTFGRGEDQPIASNLTPEGRSQNRRVEIVILPNA
ncbi:MAG: OmpA family protein [Rhodobacterales bacterium]|nr:OmpA family protein [Rhodobacterales bacterium]